MGSHIGPYPTLGKLLPSDGDSDSTYTAILRQAPVSQHTRVLISICVRGVSVKGGHVVVR